MAKVVTDNQHYTDIATAIRSVNGEETHYKPSEMATIISSIVESDRTAMDGIITRGIKGSYYNDRVTSIGDRSFMGCGSLGNITFPNVKTISVYAFQSCRGIQIADLAVCKSIGSYAFAYCSGLKALILRTTEQVCTLSTNVFNNSSIASGAGYIYVPDELVDSYKAATNWSTYANKIKPISELEGA